MRCHRKHSQLLKNVDSIKEMETYIVSCLVSRISALHKNVKLDISSVLTLETFNAQMDMFGAIGE
jgi:hypothetical protein